MADKPFDERDLIPGLGERPRSEWPKITAAEAAERPIDRLKPKSRLHKTVLDYLLKRLDNSEQEMGKFYARWEVNEKKLQAYISLPDWEKNLKSMNDKGEPPKVLSITVPYSFAAISTIVTFHLHTFTGRKPILAVGTHKEETVASARMMETVLQFNADHTRLIRHLFQFLQDGQVYGVGIIGTAWKEEKKFRTIWKKPVGGNVLGLDGQPLPAGPAQRVREKRTTYQGNEAFAQDPFLFFPDPRVPMAEVNRRGEYVFWRDFDGKHKLLQEEAAGTFKWVDAASTALPRSKGTNSARAIMSGGAAMPGSTLNVPTNFMQVDQGSIEIIPAELGLGEGQLPEKWMFTILNKDQIVQAEPLGLDHEMHPVVVIEPYTLGYGFGHLGMADYLGPLQDTISWLINSHIDNVRRVLNDMIVYDPSMIEEQDLKTGGPAKLIRMKRAAFGADIRTYLQQLPIQDVTSGHIKDAEVFFRMGELLTAASENLMGRQREGGRRSATESRLSSESGASRLAAGARIISAQGMTDLAEQWTLNTQQLLEDEFFLTLVGREGLEAPIHIGPEMLVGDFHYPVHDGTLPLDKVALLDVWKQVFQAVQADPELRQQYELSKVFEFIAELGGVKNIEAMRRGAPTQPQLLVAPDQQVENAAKAGNAIALPQLGPSGLVNALAPQPGDRLAGGLG